MNCLCCVCSLVLRVPLAKRSGVNETKPKEKKKYNFSHYLTLFYYIQ